MKAKLQQLVNNHVFRKSALLAVLLYLSPLVGMILEVSLIRIFSAGGVLDSFRALMTFMLMGQGIITTQLLKYAVIPRLAVFRSANKDREGLIFTLYFTSIVLVILSPVLIYGLFWPQHMLTQLAPGFDRELIVESAGLVQITSVGFMLLTLVGSMSAVLNFYGNFWGQPVSQLLLNITIVSAVLLFGSSATTSANQFNLLEISVGIGLFLMLAVMVWQCINVWLSTDPEVDKFNLGSTLWLSAHTLLPQLIIIAVEVIKPLAVNRTLSQVGVGSIVLYLLAFKLLMIGNLPIKAIVTVLFPDFSRLNNTATPQALAKKLMNGTIKIFSITASASIILWLLAPFIVELISHFAHIDRDKTALVVDVYRVFLWFAPFSSLGLFYMESAFAFNQKVIIILYSIVNCLLIVFLLPFYSTSGIVGIATVYSVVQGSCMVLLGLVLYMKLRTKAQI